MLLNAGNAVVIVWFNSQSRVQSARRQKADPKVGWRWCIGFIKAGRVSLWQGELTWRASWQAGSAPKS